jgi:hypothetical protein
MQIVQESAEICKLKMPREGATVKEARQIALDFRGELVPRRPKDS